MAVQFANYLSAPLNKPDYSALGDVVNNYYAGKAMPKDDLIKRIQAEFARPNAEQALLSSRLSNQKAGLDIRKLAQDLAQQAQLEKMLRTALAGGGQSSTPAQMPQGMPSNQPPMPMPGQEAPGGMPMPSMPNQPRMTYQDPLMQMLSQNMKPAGMPGMNPMPAAQSQQPMPQAMPSQPMQTKVGAFPDMQQPEQPQAPQHPADVEQVITEGNPRLAAIDQLYDTNPLSREFLEKKGFKKKTEIKFNQKTGMTSVLTTLPSGRVTLKQVGDPKRDDGIPLTSNQITKHQNVVSSVDNVLPVLDKIKKLQDTPRWVVPFVGSGNEQAVYDGLVNQALDSLMGAFGMPKTDSGMKSVLEQVQIGHFESQAAYKKRIQSLIEDLKDRRKYSSNAAKKAIDLGGGSNESGFSSGEWEPA